MEFWHNRWYEQQIGWHKTIFNELLVKHWPANSGKWFHRNDMSQNWVPLAN
ncbi:MAG TPA: hypothetical protein D7I06_09730 [Candidatus Poseidoniales archaeon]|nr:MAG TPA: hypothetical protein D7I06_09730 [Candidatus Poseidoniales archaeon]HII63875.1 hypothetical protein [Candidatus Poseidoniaceae archaeon]